jgi:tnpX site-specific recombinase (fragment)
VFEYPYRWCSSTIASILKKQEYLGHTVNFKTRKHFKDKKSKYVFEDNWLIFENTHEPIIDQENFDNVQRIRGNVKRYPDGWGEYHPLTGLMYCADCGSKMYVHRTSNYKNIPYYTCSAYIKVPCGTLCPSAHRIKAEVLLNLIQSFLQDIKKSLDEDNEAFLHFIQNEMEKCEKMEIEKKRTRLTDSKNRLHQNYLNRKANGKQKEYEDRYKEKREQLKHEKLKTLKKSGIPLSEYKKLVKKEA